MLKASQISILINEIYDGVERSNLGKITEKVDVSDKFPEGIKIHMLPMNAFLSCLNSLVPKDIVAKVEENP